MELTEQEKSKIDKEVFAILLNSLRLHRLEPTKENFEMANEIFQEGIKYIHSKNAEIDKEKTEVRF